MTVLIYFVFACSGNQPCIRLEDSHFLTEKACLESFATIIGPGPGQGRIEGNRIYIRDADPSEMFQCTAVQVTR